ncbi:MAG TPA: hypothetical protein VGZ04_06775 [Acidimicrobiales bacterium]|jgi:hypothetical protein|nr:hypothetical protein [Acidimicrobiales bacterium]
MAVFTLVAAMGISIPAVAYAGSPPSSGANSTPADSSASFLTAQKALELQLANRATQLQHLVTDVTAATSLNASASTTLQARLLTEEASINSLVAKVPTDTTRAELNTDRNAMLKDNRVYAVMSPQVFEMIEASVVANQVVTLQGNEATLQSEVASILGLPGYKNALNHYDNYVARLSNWSTRIVNIEAIVLAQTPQGYPGNTKSFVAENHAILEANIALSYASYDASIIGLATGGYTGA